MLILAACALFTTAALWFRRRRQKICFDLPKCVLEGKSSNIITCTRYWGKSQNDLKKLDDFILRAAKYSSVIIVAIRVEEDKSGAADYLTSKYKGEPRAIALPVTPWGDVTTALNSLLICASNLKYGPQQYILFQSLEIMSNAQHIQQMLNYMTSDTLVVGAALEGHHFRVKQGEIACMTEIGGLTSPWNTCALWHRPTLALTYVL